MCYYIMQGNLFKNLIRVPQVSIILQHYSVQVSKHYILQVSQSPPKHYSTALFYRYPGHTTSSDMGAL